MEIQPFTYDSIKTNGWLNGASLALPHGLGHGWAAMLWDMTWDLIDKHGFNAEHLRRLEHGRQHCARCSTSSTASSSRAAARAWSSRATRSSPAPTARGGGDECTIWAAFARRGLGYSAVQGTTDRNDNTEAFDTHPDCKRNFQSPVLAEPALNTRSRGQHGEPQVHRMTAIAGWMCWPRTSRTRGW